MTEDSKAYWAWLQLSLGEGSFKPKRILSYFPDIPSFYDAIIYPKRTQTIVAKYIGRW